MWSKEQKISHYDTLAPHRSRWRALNRYYYDQLERLLAAIVPTGKRVLEIGCGTGALLNSLEPAIGVGVDFSRAMVAEAQRNYPTLHFSCQDAEQLQENAAYDYVVLSDLVGELSDVWQAFNELHKVTNCSSRVVITHYNLLWEPILRLAERLGLKMPQDSQNWLSLSDLEHLLDLCGYEVIKKGRYTILPLYIPLISNLLNRCVPLIPLVRNLCLVQYLVAKECASAMPPALPQYSVSVIIPCRNELGNIRNAVERCPQMGSATELIFVDGESSDGTVEKIEEMISCYAGQKTIRLIHQTSAAADRSHSAATAPNKMLKLGKGDAVRKGFDAASGDILMILDSDLTVPPEDLPKFYQAIASGKGEFINGTRLVYQMEKQAMRTLNLLGNKFFSRVFTWLLEQPIKDTLCGTKVLFRTDYLKIKASRSFFGDFDPFGDFDLLFGAAKQNLKIVEVPIRYRMRTYGDIKIERFKHGLILLKMSLIGLKKLKLFS